MTIIIYGKVGRWNEMEVVSEHDFLEKIEERVCDLKHDGDGISSALENFDHDFDVLLTAEGEELQRLREELNRCFQENAREKLLEGEWTDFEIELEESDLLRALCELPKDKLTELYLKAMETK